MNPNYSSNSDVFPNTPGLIFHNFTTGNITFHAIYVYGENINESVSGTGINASILGYGMSVLKNNLPASIYSMELEFTEKIPVEGQSAPSAYLSSIPHVNTKIFIVGRAGVYFMNGAFYSPGLLAGLTAGHLENSIDSYSYIDSEANNVTNILQAEMGI